MAIGESKVATIWMQLMRPIHIPVCDENEKTRQNGLPIGL